MKDLLKKFENKEPEIVFNWKDAETEAEGWTVINSSWRRSWWWYKNEKRVGYK
jgi:hypothetical protein